MTFLSPWCTKIDVFWFFGPLGDQKRPIFGPTANATMASPDLASRERSSGSQVMANPTTERQETMKRNIGVDFGRMNRTRRTADGIEGILLQRISQFFKVRESRVAWKKGLHSWRKGALTKESRQYSWVSKDLNRVAWKLFSRKRAPGVCTWYHIWACYMRILLSGGNQQNCMCLP